MTTSGPESPKNLFTESFSTLQDPRRTHKGNIKYSIEEILFLTLSAVISGCNTWCLIEEFGNLKIDWLRKFHPYTFGIPSHDTLGSFFSALDSKEFATCFMNYAKSIATHTSGDVIALDGKTIRGVGSNSRKYPIHIVTAFCSKNRLSLAQETVDEKENEIVAIPRLLELITLKGCIVTIDAMGCQKKIAEKIREREAHYILQVKANQAGLKEQIEKLFARNTVRKSHTNDDCGHGRIETRTCEVIDNLTFLDDKEDWKDLETIVRIRSYREDKKTGKASTTFRYYISSLDANAQLINKSIRDHWSIENNLHWNLDVIFKEDHQLKRKGNSVENFNMMTKVALALIDGEKSTKKSKPTKRFKASLDDDYREFIMKI
jgi:predicted transposase YbfD/YdcC